MRGVDQARLSTAGVHVAAYAPGQVGAADGHVCQAAGLVKASGCWRRTGMPGKVNRPHERMAKMEQESHRDAYLVAHFADGFRLSDPAGQGSSTSAAPHFEDAARLPCLTIRHAGRCGGRRPMVTGSRWRSRRHRCPRCRWSHPKRSAARRAIWPWRQSTAPVGGQPPAAPAWRARHPLRRGSRVARISPSTNHPIPHSRSPTSLVRIDFMRSRP